MTMRLRGLRFAGLGLGIACVLFAGMGFGQQPAKTEPMTPGMALQNVGAVCQRALEEIAWTGKERRVIGEAFDSLAAAVKAYEQYTTSARSQESGVGSQEKKPVDNIGPVEVVPLKDVTPKKKK